MTGQLFARGRTELAPGAVHLPDWLVPAAQRRIVAAARDWATGPVPMRAPKVRGGQMSVRMVSLGWHWRPYRYSRTADDAGGGRVLPLPGWLVELGRRAVAEAYDDPAAGRDYAPDVALVNFYDAQARMGMHQDREERDRSPIVSLSIGDSCLFRFGNTASRARPYTDVELRSGDLFVFGGPSRMAFHGVPRIEPHTADPDCGLAAGRLNITLRRTGLC